VGVVKAPANADQPDISTLLPNMSSLSNVFPHESHTLRCAVVIERHFTVAPAMALRTICCLAVFGFLIILRQYADTARLKGLLFPYNKFYLLKNNKLVRYCTGFLSSEGNFFATKKHPFLAICRLLYLTI
jgi:hypothetical protein